jgi:hypothetical protein
VFPLSPGQQTACPNKAKLLMAKSDKSRGGWGLAPSILQNSSPKIRPPFLNISPQAKL